MAFNCIRRAHTTLPASLSVGGSVSVSNKFWEVVGGELWVMGRGDWCRWWVVEHGGWWLVRGGSWCNTMLMGCTSVRNVTDLRLHVVVYDVVRVQVVKRRRRRADEGGGRTFTQRPTL